MNRKNLKELLEIGGHITFSYKEDLKDWVGKAEIYPISGVYGLEPCCIVSVPTADFNIKGYKRFENIDDAIDVFVSAVCREKNLMWRQKEAIDELYNDGNISMDLDKESDREKVYERRKLILENENKL